MLALLSRVMFFNVFIYVGFTAPSDAAMYLTFYIVDFVVIYLTYSPFLPGGFRPLCFLERV